MAIKLRVVCYIEQVGNGAGTALLGQNISNEGGFGGTLGAGPVGSAQSLQLPAINEPVPGGDSPTGANFVTAFTQLATDLATQLNTAGAYSGGSATPLALVQAWSTGGP